MASESLKDEVNTSAPQPRADKSRLVTDETPVPAVARTEASLRESEMDKAFKDREDEAQKSTTHHILYLTLANGYSAFVIFIFRLISIDGLFGVALSVALTIYAYYATEDNMTWDGGIMNWVLLSFAVITPMSASIAMAFGRREEALRLIARLRSTLLGIYTAHANWDWSTSGKPNSGKAAWPAKDWVAHADAVLRECLGIGDDFGSLLSLPSVCRARHRVTRMGKKEASMVLNLAYDLYDSILERVGRLSNLCEDLKMHGLPGNEAARMRQWERLILETLEGLRMIKYYRTPQALRSFARLFTVFLPPFYAPYFAQAARDLNSLAAGIIFAIVTSIALTALFESISQMEDPFVAHLTLDGIDVTKEFQVFNRRELFCLRDKVFFVSAGPNSELQKELLYEERSLRLRFFDE